MGYSWTWDGSSWEGSVKSWTNGAPYNIYWMRLAADPNSDDLLLAFVDYYEDIYTLPWNGSAWGTHTLIESSALGGNDYNAPFSVIFEKNESHSGHALIVYSDTTGLRYQHSTDGGTNWGGENTINTDDEGYWIQTVHQDEDVIHMALHDTNNDLETFVWDNSSWTKKTTRETDLQYDTYHTFESFSLTSFSGPTIEVTLGDHASGQIDDQFNAMSSQNDADLFRFQLQHTAGDANANVDQIVF